MTTPSNDTFYQWGYHDPSKDPVLPLTQEDRQILERIISTQEGNILIGYQLLPSGEGLEDQSRYYVAATDPNKTHISAPALYPHPNGTGEVIDRGNYYFSSGNYSVWPSPEGQDRYSAYWWDVSGIYFTPNVYGSGYYAYPTLPKNNAGAIILFDDLDHEAYWSVDSEVRINPDKKYLLWLNGRNVEQMGIFHYGRQLSKIIEIPLSYSKRKKKTIYKKEDRKYYYSHFSSADHDKVDKGFEDFQIFYNYIHYIPELKNANQLTHEKVEGSNEIPFLSNTKSVYLYSVYGAGKFRNLQSQDWTSVNFWDSSYSPKGIPSDFHNVLKSPSPPFPVAKRGEEESEDKEYNSEEELQEKLNAVSGLLGF